MRHDHTLLFLFVAAGLGFFRNVVLVSSEQDGYVARASARIMLTPAMASEPGDGMSGRWNSQKAGSMRVAPSFIRGEGGGVRVNLVHQTPRVVLGFWLWFFSHVFFSALT
jgi:hypothetical protein